MDLKNIQTSISKKTAAPKPQKFSFQTVITVDPYDSVVKFFSMTEGQQASLTVDVKKCKSRLYDDEFFDVFGKLANEYALAHPSAQDAGVTIVLPERGVTTDVLNIPTLRKKKAEESIEVSIKDLFRNESELKINKILVQQNKQYTTYYLSAMQNSLLSRFYAALTPCKMIPQVITFSASSAANAVQTLIPKLHNTTYMLMDIKPDHTVISFVSKGTVSGYYNLPFGYSLLEHKTVAAEDMLFDHSVAELVVANAKAKAKAKQTMTLASENAQAMAEAIAENEEKSADGELQMDEEMNGIEDDTLNAEDETETENETGDIFTMGGNGGTQSNMVIKTLPKKQPRRLPKFMLRPEPQTEEEYGFENFRLFVKYALNLISINQKKLWHEKPDAVYVNMPEQFKYLFDMVNEEKKENGISFLPLDFGNAGDKIVNNLETFGGFFTSSFNSLNNF